MDAVKIHREMQGDDIRLVAKVAGVEGEGELTLKSQGSGLYIADHTGVPDYMGGQGIGSRLVEFMIENARENGYKVIPQCPFIAQKWNDHPEWSDVIVSRDSRKAASQE